VQRHVDGQLAVEVNDEVDHYADALADVVAGINTHPDLTRAQFEGLVAELTPARLPGASAVVLRRFPDVRLADAPVPPTVSRSADTPG
jgi:hypothetical protein